jgi:hypothetical protein
MEKPRVSRLDGFQASQPQGRLRGSGMERIEKAKAGL